MEGQGGNVPNTGTSVSKGGQSKMQDVKLKAISC